jgi:hypothetical protein
MGRTHTTVALLVAVAVLAGGGCNAAELPMPTLAASSTRTAKLALLLVSDASACATKETDHEDGDAYVSAFPGALALALYDAGYEVVNPNQPHDLTARFKIERCALARWGSDGNRFDASLVLEAGAEWVDRVAVHYEKMPVSGITQRLAIDLVNLAGASAPVAALARDGERRASLRRASIAVHSTPPRAPAATPLPPKPVAPPPTIGAAPSQVAFVAAAPQPAAYALIVGIDHYRDVPAAPGARADAEHFAALAKRTFGLKEEHVRIAVDDHATRTDVLAGLKWLKDNVSAGGRVYFFFSGHGSPATDASTYLMPYDGNPKDVASTALATSDVMHALAETKAKEVLAVIDSCFSGAGGRSVLPPGTRPLMRVKDATPDARMALFTASRGDEISGLAPGENAGVFTKFVVQALGTGVADGNGDGQVSLQELSDWVGPRVARDAKKDNREQHPSLVVGSGLGGAANFIVEYGLATN